MTRAANTQGHTPGPWVWSNATSQWMLVTPDRGRLLVLDFVRKGMQGAAPRVRDVERCLMVDFDPNHPDARLIAAAPLLLEAVEDLCQEDLVGENIETLAQHGAEDLREFEWNRGKIRLLFEKARAALTAATGEGGAG